MPSRSAAASASRPRSRRSGPASPSLTNTDRMTGELADTARSLSAIAREAGEQSSDGATADETSTNVQTVATATSQLGESVQAIKGKIHEATAIVQRASSMAVAANETMGALASSASTYRRGGRISSAPSPGKPTCLPSTPRIEAAARRRGRARVCGGCLRGQGARDPDRQGDEEISAQIAEVQSATRQAVDNVGAIATIMGDIDRFTAALSRTSTSRTRATSEITHGIGQAATGTATASRRHRRYSGGDREHQPFRRHLVLTTAKDLSQQTADARPPSTASSPTWRRRCGLDLSLVVPAKAGTHTPRRML